MPGRRPASPEDRTTVQEGIVMSDRDQGVTLADLAGRDFANVDETAQIMRIDQRTVRRRCEDGTIPAIKVGDWRIPVSWLREQARVAS
jgi:Helix-turn-helix domain